MTQEEKAKRYDEAIERAKRMFSEKELNGSVRKAGCSQSAFNSPPLKGKGYG